eukprot:3508364-Rhodomonas_salina.2
MFACYEWCLTDKYQVRRIRLCACYAMPGTDIAFLQPNNPEHRLMKKKRTRGVFLHYAVPSPTPMVSLSAYACTTRADTQIAQTRQDSIVLGAEAERGLGRLRRGMGCRTLPTHGTSMMPSRLSGLRLSLLFSSLLSLSLWVW